MNHARYRRPKFLCECGSGALLTITLYTAVAAATATTVLSRRDITT